MTIWWTISREKLLFSSLEKIFIENRLKLVSHKVEVLNKLCTNLDPYTNIPAACQKELNNLGIFELKDPFVVTNKLVILLEESVEELQELEAKKKSYS